MAKRTCSIDGCENPSVGREWCRKHYARWQRNGDPLVTIRLYRAPVADRLASKLELTPDGCREFTGYRNECGYGRIKVGKKMPFAHRVAYEAWVGPIPEGANVCHHCDNPPCCEPSHLFVGSQADNHRDMVAKGRDNQGHGLARGEEHGRILRESAARRRRQRATDAGFPEDWKRCFRCTEWKPSEAFGPNAARPDGRQAYCSPCAKAYSRQRRLAK